METEIKINVKTVEEVYGKGCFPILFHILGEDKKNNILVGQNGTNMIIRHNKKELVVSLNDIVKEVINKDSKKV